MYLVCFVTCNALGIFFFLGEKRISRYVCYFRCLLEHETCHMRMGENEQWQKILYFLVAFIVFLCDARTLPAFILYSLCSSGAVVFVPQWHHHHWHITIRHYFWKVFFLETRRQGETNRWIQKTRKGPSLSGKICFLNFL